MGWVVVKAFTGQDVRLVGSGRTGGTNAIRAAGWPAGILTGFGDMAKGFGAVYLARLFFSGDPGLPFIEALCAIASVAGHNWSIYIGFRGGAGTGPNVGAATALWPITGLILVPTVPLILVMTGYASVTSTLAAVTVFVILLVRYFLGLAPLAYPGYALVTMVLVAIALIPNYKRLIEGTERLIGPRAKKVSPQSSNADS
jgi:glycerol-3-phosphate acyltransferase PlsY